MSEQVEGGKRKKRQKPPYERSHERNRAVDKAMSTTFFGMECIGAVDFPNMTYSVFSDERADGLVEVELYAFDAPFDFEMVGAWYPDGSVQVWPYAWYAQVVSDRRLKYPPDRPRNKKWRYEYVEGKTRCLVKPRDQITRAARPTSGIVRAARPDRSLPRAARSIPRARRPS